MKKWAFIVLLTWFSAPAQNTQSLAGTWTLSKVIKVERMSSAHVRTARETLEGNVLLTFNADGTFKSTADSKKELRHWNYQRKTRTIILSGKQQRFKAKILNFKPDRMRVKMQLSRSVLGEFILVKNP